MRARKRSAATQITPTQARETAGLMAQSTEDMEHPNRPAHSFASSIMEEEHDSIMRWTTDSNTNVSEDDSLDATSIDPTAQHPYDNTHGTSDAIAPLEAASELQIPQGLDFNLDDFLGYPMDPSSEDMALQSARTSAEENAQKKRLIDYQCIVSCCEIVMELEGYVNENVRSLQIVLGVVKKAMEKVNELHTLQQLYRTPRCMAMLAVIMYQVVALLESGCANLLNPQQDQRPDVSAQLHGWLPGLALGGLSMSVEDQSFYRTHLLLKTVQQASELLLKGKKLAGVRESGTNHPAAAPEDQERCFAQLEGRLRRLTERIGGAK